MKKLFISSYHHSPTFPESSNSRRAIYFILHFFIGLYGNAELEMMTFFCNFQFLPRKQTKLVPVVLNVVIRIIFNCRADIKYQNIIWKNRSTFLQISRN